MIASLAAFNDTNPEGTKFTHICLVYFQDEMRPKNKNDKVVDDTSNEETMKSTCRQVKKEDKEIPHSHKMLIVLRIEIALHKTSNRQVG